MTHRCQICFQINLRRYNPASRTHYDPAGVRTAAPPAELRRVIAHVTARQEAAATAAAAAAVAGVCVNVTTT